METLRLLVALLLPWVVGYVCLRGAWRSGTPGAEPARLGYGYVVGMLLTTVVMRLQDLAGFEQDFLITASGLAALVLVVALGLRGSPAQMSGETPRARPGVLWWGLLGLLIMRVFSLGHELVANPLYAWDAWMTWAFRARVWFNVGSLVPFVDGATWLAQEEPAAYTLLNADYPATVSLVQLWMAEALGRWDASLVNLPWLLCFAALGLAFYGQGRASGVAPVPSLACTYILLSLPLLGVHVASAGLADLWMATVFGLAAMALFRGLAEGTRGQAALALGLALACTQIKAPGLLWVFTLAPALVLARMRRPGRALTAGVAGVGVIFGAVVLRLRGAGPVDFGPVRLELHTEIWRSFVESLFWSANWHLFWYLWLVAIVAGLLARVRDRWFLGQLSVVVTGFLALLVIYGLTGRAEAALYHTQLSRAILHLAPVACFALLTVFGRGLARRGSF